VHGLGPALRRDAQSAVLALAAVAIQALMMIAFTWPAASRRRSPISMTESVSVTMEA
jgi:hypothetical protein